MRLLVLALMVGVPGVAAGQAHEHEPARAQFSWGAQAIGLLTHATPAVGGEARTETYLTQPNLFLHGRYGALSATAALNFEGITLKQGELNAGTWGEGFYDKRHPHTYLHEAVASFTHTAGDLGLSLSAGKGFASFGTDDPMVRPLVKFPANHHLAQVLERLIVVGAARTGFLLLEGTLFNGDEPLDSKSLGQLGNLGDSWAARLTILPRAGYELQGSYAFVNSPEQHEGSGLDQKKLSLSLRHERTTGSLPHYFLIEWVKTREYSDTIEVVGLDSWLAEGALRRGSWRAGARIERTLRPEEERAGSIFRSPWPHIDEHIFGLTRWLLVSANISHAFRLGRLALEPVAEIGHQRPRPETQPSLFEPREMYGSNRLWSVSIGLRLAAGAPHTRMGRYGAAATAGHAH